MRVTFITTFFNEEKQIEQFLASLFGQTRLPDEVILVDGGSTDKTFDIISNYDYPIKHVKILLQKGNRSVGRNEAVRRATGDIIVCSDVGCILERNWLKEIVKPFADKSVDVVAGFYDAKSETIFQKSLVPYTLIMPDQVNPDSFLPATRSVAFRKNSFEKVGGFDESLSHNEDYVFARKLKEKGLRIFFAKDAVVSWIPRKTFKQAFIMFFRFALGDTEAGIYRDKVLLLLLRYFLGGYFTLLSYLYRSLVPLLIVGVGGIFYILWAIWKNYRYVQSEKAFFYLPAIQLTADAAVISGSLVGLFKRLKKNFLPSIIQNRPLVFLIGIYSVIMLSVIRWGLPGNDHPFLYHMDEWHQLQSVRFTMTHGNPNMPGAAYGPLLQFLLSGIYLVPFVLLRIINPFLLTSSFSYLEMQERLFELLRINTLLFGIGAIVGIYIISKKYLRTPAFWTASLFLFTPLFLSLSNYFKYDIALIAWMIWGLLACFAYQEKQTTTRFIIAGILIGCALATKISSAPLIPLYIFSYFLFTKKSSWNGKTLLLGLLALTVTFFLLGVPNLFFGEGDYREFLYSNLVTVPHDTANFILGMPYPAYLLTRQFPLLFGNVFALLTGISILYWLGKVGVRFLRTKRLSYIQETFLLCGLLLFLISLYPLKLFAIGNRALVLLPFTTLLIVSMIFHLLPSKQYKRTPIILGLVLFLQILQCIPWISMKWTNDPRQTSSIWIQEHIPQGTNIGVELIPIYQYLPDIALKEYYLQEEKRPTTYHYSIVDTKTAELPPVVIISNANFEKNYLISSPKKDLLKRLEKDNYHVTADFYAQGHLSEGLIRNKDFYILPLAPFPHITVFTKELRKN